MEWGETINVLKGDLSIVGPRPERPHFVQKFLNDITRYNNRPRLKAGIPGCAQVNGWRGGTSIQKRLEYDLYYLRNGSFFFGLRIIVLTILSAMVGRNAYEPAFCTADSRSNPAQSPGCWLLRSYACFKARRGEPIAVFARQCGRNLCDDSDSCYSVLHPNCDSLTLAAASQSHPREEIEWP